MMLLPIIKRINNEIKNTKKNFDDWTKYEISVDYDENGFVYKMTIEK